MPNPVRKLKRTDRLKPRQKMIVKRLRSAGMPVMVYRRKSNTNRLSVHNPFLDVKRKAKKGSDMVTKRMPHARDTKKQRMAKKKQRLMASRRKGKIKRRGILFP